MAHTNEDTAFKIIPAGECPPRKMPFAETVKHVLNKLEVGQSFVVPNVSPSRRRHIRNICWVQAQVLQKKFATRLESGGTALRVFYVCPTGFSKNDGSGVKMSVSEAESHGEPGSLLARDIQGMLSDAYGDHHYSDGADGFSRGEDGEGLECHLGDFTINYDPTRPACCRWTFRHEHDGKRQDGEIV